jgi:hypothetical protein
VGAEAMEKYFQNRDSDFQKKKKKKKSLEPQYSQFCCLAVELSQLIL